MTKYQGLIEKIKDVRKEKKLSLADLSVCLNIRKKYLEALEELNFDDLPAPVYAVGYLKILADFLEIEYEFFDQQPNTHSKTNSPEKQPSPDARIKAGKTYVFSGLLFLALAYGHLLKSENYNQNMEISFGTINLPNTATNKAILASLQNKLIER